MSCHGLLDWLFIYIRDIEAILRHLSSKGMEHRE